jgi:hypothetical protein
MDSVMRFFTLGCFELGIEFGARYSIRILPISCSTFSMRPWKSSFLSLNYVCNVSFRICICFIEKRWVIQIFCEGFRGLIKVSGFLIETMASCLIPWFHWNRRNRFLNLIETRGGSYFRGLTKTAETAFEVVRKWIRLSFRFVFLLCVLL